MVKLKWLLAIPITYVVLAPLLCWRPSIEGTVMDTKTGLPVQGARVWATYMGGYDNPIAMYSPRQPVLAGGWRTTDAQGRFHVSGFAPVAALATGWLFPRTSGVRVYLLAKDQISVMCESGLRSTGTDSRCSRPDFGVLVAKELRRGSYHYAISTPTPQTEEEWEEKVIQTSIIAGFLRKEADQFLYNDCVAFAERYPHSSLAGECVFALMLTSLTDSPQRLREDLKRGYRRRSDLPILVLRGQRVLELAGKVAHPPPKPAWQLDSSVMPIAVSYEEELKKLGQCVSEMRRILGEQASP